MHIYKFQKVYIIWKQPMVVWVGGVFIEDIRKELDMTL